MKDANDLEDERQQMFNLAMEVIHNCIWAEDDDIEESDKGLLIHIKDSGLARMIRVFKFNMEDSEASSVLKAVATSVVEKEHTVERYN